MSFDEVTFNLDTSSSAVVSLIDSISLSMLYTSEGEERILMLGGAHRIYFGQLLALHGLFTVFQFFNLNVNHGCKPGETQFNLIVTLVNMIHIELISSTKLDYSQSLR